MSEDLDGWAKNWSRVTEQYKTDGPWDIEKRSQIVKMKVAFDEGEYLRGIFHHGIAGLLEAHLQHCHKSWLYGVLALMAGGVITALYQGILWVI